MQTRSANKETTTDFFICLDSTDRLKVPQAHPWNKEKVYPDAVILKDKTGNTWRVELEIIEDQVCFVDGWSMFVEDNNVKVANFIFFQNAGHDVLNFRLFDSKTACETGGFIGLKFVITDDEDEEDEDVDALIKEEEDDDEEEEEEETVNQKRKTKVLKNGRKRGKGTQEIYRNEIFKSNANPRPKNPFFVTHKRPKRQKELYVPVEMISVNKLQLPTKTIMRDNRGNQWKTELTKWEDGRLWYNGGWDSFCRIHGVRVGEACICEFVEESKNGLTLFVYKVKESG